MENSIVLSRNADNKPFPLCSWERTAIKFIVCEIPTKGGGNIGLRYATKGQKYFVKIEKLYSSIICFKDFSDIKDVELVYLVPQGTDAGEDGEYTIKYVILDYPDGIPADVKRIFPGSLY